MFPKREMDWDPIYGFVPHDSYPVRVHMFCSILFFCVFWTSAFGKNTSSRILDFYRCTYVLPIDSHLTNYFNMIPMFSGVMGRKETQRNTVSQSSFHNKSTATRAYTRHQFLPGLAPTSKYPSMLHINDILRSPLKRSVARGTQQVDMTQQLFFQL